MAFDHGDQQACVFLVHILNKTPLESTLWEQTLEKVAYMIHSFDNMPLNSGVSSLNALFKMLSCCFPLLSPVKETQTIV